MDQRQNTKAEDGGAEIVDFDEALLDACAPEVRADLLTEAEMLAEALAPEDRGTELRDLAHSLSTGGGAESEIPRPRARRLAAALRRLARDYEA